MLERLLGQRLPKRRGAQRASLRISCQRALMFEREPGAVMLAVQVALDAGEAVELREMRLERPDGGRVVLQPCGETWPCTLQPGQSLQALTALVEPPFRIELACRARAGSDAAPAWTSTYFEVTA